MCGAEVGHFEWDAVAGRTDVAQEILPTIMPQSARDGIVELGPATLTGFMRRTPCEFIAATAKSDAALAREPPSPNDRNQGRAVSNCPINLDPKKYLASRAPSQLITKHIIKIGEKANLNNILKPFECQLLA